MSEKKEFVYKLYEPKKKFSFKPHLRKKMENSYISLLEELGGRLHKKSVNDYYFNSDIEKNTILIQGLGTNVRGNTQLILNELNHNDDYKDFTIYVRTKEDVTDDIVKEYIQKNDWKRTSTVPKAYNKRLETCEYMLTESYFPYGWVKRTGQKVINIWHGTVMKHLGMDKNGKKAHLSGIQQKNFINADFFMYPNEHSKKILSAAYGIEHFMQGKAFMLGYPRTGGLLCVNDKRKKELKNKLAPNGEHIYAYMPTFRGYLSEEQYLEKEKVFLDYLDTVLSDEQILFVNLHHHYKDTLSYDNYDHIKKFPELIDSYELLTVTDALISDYSSVMFDYMILKKQIILHIPDYDKYSKHQGLYKEFEDLPFDKAYSKEEVADYLEKGLRYDADEVVRNLCCYDSKDNVKKLCGLFIGDTGALEMTDHERTDKKKAVIYSQKCKPGAETALLHDFIRNYDRDKFEIYIACDEADVSEKENLASAYPMLKENTVIGTRKNPLLSSLGNGVKELFEKGTLSFDDALKLLKYEYALIPKRMFGEADIDMLLIYDTSDPELLMGLSLADADEKVLFVQKETIKSIVSGNVFLRKALYFASEYVHAVFVSDEEYAFAAEKLLAKEWTGKIKVVSECDELVKIVGLKKGL